MFPLKFISLFVALASVAFATPTPTHELAKRGAVLTAQYATETEVGFWLSLFLLSR